MDDEVARMALRERNLSPERLSETTLKSLDSSLKKVTAFLKKIKERLGEETRKQLLEELPKLNLSKYVEEVALGVSEAELKLKDLAAAAEFCSAMHVAYAPFAAALAPHLRKNAMLTPPPPAKPGAPPTVPESDSQRSSRLTKKRVSLRLIFELLALGVFTDASQALTCLVAVVKEEGLPSSDVTPTPMPNLAVLSSVAKAVLADPLLASPAVRTAAAAAKDGASGAAASGDVSEAAATSAGPCMLSEAEQRKLLTITNDYFMATCKAVQEGYAHLRNVERANQRALLAKGDLTDEAAAAYERAKKAHERLMGGCSTLAEALLRPMPVLEEAPAAEEAAKKVDVTLHGASDAAAKADDVYEDAESRSFYEQLPDLQAVLPAVLFAADGGGPAAAAESKEAIERLLAQMPSLAGKETVDELASELVVGRVRLHVRAAVRALSAPPPPSPELGPVLLPRYARLAAILGSCFKPIGSELVSALMDDLDEAITSFPKAPAPAGGKGAGASGAKGSGAGSGTTSGATSGAGSNTGSGGGGGGGGVGGASDLGPALLTARYIAELTKFRLVTAAQVFGILKKLLDDFAPARVQLACELLDGCGKFLYAKPETNQRCEAMLALLAKLKTAHRLPYELSAAIDNALCACRPPERPALIVDERPMLERYVEYLLHQELRKETLEKVVKQLRKLPWTSQAAEVERWVLTALLDCAQVKYHTINLVACVISALYRYHEGAMVRVVDAAIERARCAVDRNDYRDCQRRVCLMKLLGELYNYRLLDSSSIFRMLYMIVPVGAGVWGQVIPLTHVAAHEELRDATKAPSARPRLHTREPMVDGPDNTSRVRCVCALLDACGGYFNKGSAKRKLDVFLVYFSRYLFCKVLIADVEFILGDTLTMLRPKMRRPATYAEACEAVAKLEAALATDQKSGESLAHELLHGGGAAGGAGGAGGASGGADEDDEGDDEGGGADDVDVADEAEGDGGDDVDAELADVERQLAELNAEDDEADGADKRRKEEEEVVVVVRQERREASKDEEDEFEKEMQSMLASAKATKAATEAKPLPAIGAVLRAGTGASRVASAVAGVRGAGGAGGAGGVGGSDGTGELTLRVLGRGAKAHKLEVKEVVVPISNPLAQMVIKMDEAAQEERQRLKRQTLQLAEDHEAAPRGYIPQIRQDAVDAQGKGWKATGAGNYN